MFDARHCSNGIKKVVALSRVFDIAFIGEGFYQIFVDNAIGVGKKGEDMRNEVALVIIKAVVPVMQVLGGVHLLSSPE
jgi:hypothetical protein